MPCFTALLRSSFTIRASGIATSLESTPRATPHSIRASGGSNCRMVWQTAGKNSSASKRLASLRPYSTRCEPLRGGPRAGFVQDFPRLLAVRRSCSGEQQRLQHLHVVLGAVIEFIEQKPLLGFGLPPLADIHQHVD